MTPRLSIIIVSWNVKELLRQSLESIQQHLTGISHEVIVVDNASTDGSAAMVAKEFPQVALISNSKNNGFGRANNQGLNQARGEYILFLNDDTQLMDGGVAQAVDYLAGHLQVGLIGLQLKNPDGSVQPSVRHFPKLGDQLMYLFKLHLLLPNSKPIRHYLSADFDYSKPATVDQVMGAAMVMPTALAKKLGGFDQRYPNWFEEVDLCQRVKQLNKEVWYLPLAPIIHLKGASFSQQRPIKLQRMYNYSMRQYFKRWEPWFAYALICFFQPVGLLLAGIIQLLESFGFGIRKLKPKTV